jgi:cell division protein FtsQ
MWHKLLKISGFLLLIVFFILTLSFTSRVSKNVVCRNISVEFKRDESIRLNENEIIRLIKSADSQVEGKLLDEINSDLIEREVEKHQAILNADVYKVIAKDTSLYKGVLAVKIEHRKPVVRVMSESGSYYLDKFGGKIPVSTNYTANVLVTTGYFNEKFAREKLLPFILFIENDEFWNAQIEQIHVERNGDVLLTPLVGDHIIELGSIGNYHEKLRNMKVFYEKVLAKNNWNKYKIISLKYKNQVVAKKG